jgi:hypothetical protein
VARTWSAFLLLVALPTAGSTQTPDAANGAIAKRGVVADERTGQGLSRALVVLPTVGARMVTDERGQFTLPPLEPGRYRIRAEHLGYDETEGELLVPGEPELALLLSPSDLDDSTTPGQVEGRIADDSGDWLRNVEVRVAGRELARTLSNGSGRFVLRGVEPGLHELRFALLGHEERSVMMVVHPNRTTLVDATLSTRPIELAPIEVAVLSSSLDRSGFYRRERMGFGSHFDRRDIERTGAWVLHEIVRRAAGVAVVQAGFDEHIAVSRRSLGAGASFRTDVGDIGTTGPCALKVFFNGVPTFEGDLDWINLDQVEAVEVYNSPVNVPVEYNIEGMNQCGVILVWTRRG